MNNRRDAHANVFNIIEFYEKVNEEGVKNGFYY